MTLRNFLCLVFVVLMAAFADAAPFQKVAIRNAVSRNAVCNDGTPGIYYFRPGTGQGSQSWVIFLAGGGFCYSAKDCKQRSISSPELMTSNGKPSTLVLPGLLSNSAVENPDFYNFNQVVIPYCSSDLWSGNRAKGAGTGGFAFRGRTIFRAVIQDLKLRSSGANLATAQQILLSGTSAGGVGVMVHLDWLAQQLPQAKLRGINDAGWTPDVQTFFPLPDISRVDRALALWDGKPDASCAKANPKAQYRCYTSSVYPYISNPLMVQMSQYDTVYLGALGVHAPFSSSEAQIANLFALAVRDSLQPVDAAFSPRTHTHGLLPYPRFSTVKINGFSLRDVLGDWFFDRTGPIKIIKP